MGSTDPAGDSHHSSGGSCGLVSSLFPNSCRGRAEAFARRLHRRLTSLSGASVSNEDNDEDDYSEKESLNTIAKPTWLQSSNYKTNIDTSSSLNYVFEHQPRHSPEKDLYYDYGLSTEQSSDVRTHKESLDGTGSPQELDSLLVNNKDGIEINHCDNHGGDEDGDDDDDDDDDGENRDSESGYIFSSPLDASPSNERDNETYFDPESSEGDKLYTEDFYDPIYMSESDAACDMSYDQAELSCQKPPGRRRFNQVDRKIGDTSESSSSVNERVNELQIKKSKKNVTCSSEESLNDAPCSSLDSTSPSYESLWSTFEDSTVSQDENMLTVTLSTNDNVVVERKLPSESEFVPTNICESINNLAMLSSNDETDSSNELSCDRRNDAEVPSQSNVNDGELKLKRDDSSMYKSTMDIPGALAVECAIMNDHPTAEETQKTEVKLDVSENGDNNCVDMPRLFQRLSCSSYKSFDKEFVENSEESLKNDEENNKDDGEDEEEVEEEEENRPRRLRRCSSLKTGKTPPGTPGRKKIVRFADVLGLDLADVRTFLDEIPKVPNSAFSDLVYDDIFLKDSSPSFYDGAISNGSLGQNLNNVLSRPKFDGIGLKPDKMLMPLFQQPGELPNYLDLVRDRRVCLENAVIQDVMAMCVQGTVRVRNLDFHKSVHIRYTLDSWKNFSDLQACYVNDSCDGFSDKFSFQIYCHTLKVGHKLELAVRFQCKGVQYWDNNAGNNYCFQCLPMTPAANYIPITALNTINNRDWSPTFY